jgi:hypothetical protein
VPGEECDGGLGNSDVTPDACRTSCLLPRCGDGTVDPGRGEECEPPGRCDVECRTEIVPPTTVTVVTTTTLATASSTSTSSTTTSSTTSTTLLGPPCEGDPSRTIFAGFPPGFGQGPCRRFDGNPTPCEQAWAVTLAADVVSCFFRSDTMTCEGCGPVNQEMERCTNACAVAPTSTTVPSTTSSTSTSTSAPATSTTIDDRAV